jgi:Uma2 family endonuclease
MVSQPVVSLRYRVGSRPEAWVLPEGPVPESTAHDAALYRICSLLLAWAARVANGARVARNLAIRWLPEHPRTGLDPDVAVLLPGPPDFDDLTSCRVWEAGRTPPAFAVEVVSQSHPYKDYSSIHEGYAAMGVPELLVFDPQLFGPRSLGGPALLQLWRRDVSGAFERVHFGNEPAYSNVLDAWLSADGRNLVISGDRAAKQRWPTLEEAAAEAAVAAARVELAGARQEAERAQQEAERAQQEAAQERAQREALQRRVQELEAAKLK